MDLGVNRDGFVVRGADCAADESGNEMETGSAAAAHIDIKLN